jgi:hypothetical protein
VSELFAGIARDRSTRFISNVGRGRSYDGRCPEWASSLAAEAAEQEARAVEASRAAKLTDQAEAAEREPRLAALRSGVVSGLAPDHHGKSGFMLSVVERPAGTANPFVSPAWILYALGGGDTAVVPWRQDEGYQCSAHAGRRDDGSGGHRATLMDALLYLRSQRVAVRMTSDIGGLAEWVEALSYQTHGQRAGARSRAVLRGGRA